MKNVFKVIFVSVLTVLAVGCSKDNDSPQVTPLRDFGTQYAFDNEAIETFLKTHALPAEASNPNTMQHLTWEAAIPELDPTSIWGTDPDTPNANVLQWQVQKDGITYTVYYLQLQQGSGPNSKSPCNYDAVLTAYEGQLLDGTVFDSNFFPQAFLPLTGVIRGWSEIFPKFKTGSQVSNSDGSVTYSNFGAGIMFLPSGLAYYNSTAGGGISAYSPLIFSFKLYGVERIDNDGDGIFSFQEDLNGDGYIRDYDITGSYEDDTDRDGVPDALDIDDDWDNIMTKDEIKYTLFGNTYYYPFDGAAVNDPATPQDETLGIPSCSGDYTSPTRFRKHLDPNCQ